MKFSKFNIIYLNLEKRTDRKQHIEKQLRQLQIYNKSILLPSIDGQMLNAEERTYHRSYFKVHNFSKREDRILGKIGCYLTHIKALELAIKNNYDNVLILEDDCQFDFSMDIRNLDIIPPDNCDIFYLGGFFWRKKPEETLQTGDWVKIDKKNLKIACTFAYGIIGREKIKDIYHKLLNSQAEAIDLMYIKNIQKNNNCFIINPVICKQNMIFSSDVTNIGGKDYKYTNKQDAFKYI